MKFVVRSGDCSEVLNTSSGYFEGKKSCNHQLKVFIHIKDIHDLHQQAHKIGPRHPQKFNILYIDTKKCFL